jgi:hypothetical protein
MKQILSLSFICLLTLSANIPINTDINADKTRIRELLNQANANLAFLDKIKEKPGDRKLSHLFITDLNESHKRLEQLEGNFKKLDDPTSSNTSDQSNTVEQLLAQASRLARHTQAYEEYFIDNPKGDGLRDVKVEVYWNNESASGWRVAYAGYNDTPAKVDTESVGYDVCLKHKQGLTNTYRESDSFKESIITIKVMGGLGYLWLKHPDGCTPYSEAKEIDDSTVSMQLNARSKNP